MNTGNVPKSNFSTAFSNFNRNYVIFYALLGTGLILSLLTPRFLTVPNLMIIFRQASIIAIVAAGQFFVLVGGHFDLSVGSTVTLSGVIFAGAIVFFGIDPVTAGVLAVIVGLIIGFINGILVTKIGLPAFIATMATMMSCAGLALLLTRARPISRLPDSIAWIGRGAIGDIRTFGVPYMVIIMFAVFIVAFIITEKTNFGRYIYAIGGNSEAAYLSGIPTTKYKISTFLISGMTASVASIILVSRLGAADPHAGTGFEFQAITACVIGGTAITGGRGKIFGVLIGALFLATLFNGMTLLNVDTFIQQILQGVVLAVAVGIDAIKNKMVSRQD